MSDLAVIGILALIIPSTLLVSYLKSRSSKFIQEFAERIEAVPARQETCIPDEPNEKTNHTISELIAENKRLVIENANLKFEIEKLSHKKQ